MGNYVEQNLNRNETIVQKATLSKIPLICKWIASGVFVILLIVAIVIFSSLKSVISLYLAIVFGILAIVYVKKAIASTLRYKCTELAVTNKRVVGKTGVITTEAMDSPLDKIQTVSVSSGLFGKIFHYGKVRIALASLDTYRFDFVTEPDAFKQILMKQINQYEEDKGKEQAKRMADVIASAQKN